MKKALLIGINYTRTDTQLNGCINDIEDVSKLLVSKFGYKDPIVITDTTPIKPTKANIEKAILELTKDCKSGDTLVFYYSGHGTSVPNQGNLDESDNKDECLVPLDYLVSGVILDDWIYNNLCLKIPAGATLYGFTDCCHSGTMFDLKYNFNSVTKALAPVINKVYVDKDWDNKFVMKVEPSKETSGTVYLLSGCLDPDTSMDSTFNGRYNGAFTFCFIKSIEDAPNAPMYNILKEINARLIMNNYKQSSQLSVSKMTDASNPLKL